MVKNRFFLRKKEELYIKNEVLADYPTKE